ncbi:MAG: hypothetical protein IJG35_09420, partial [Bacteroidales bacterium]|nr:hypothetical protein [Bacteroidales bacterium]
GHLFSTLLCSTGFPREDTPFHETPAGEFAVVSWVGGFWSDGGLREVLRLADLHICEIHLVNRLRLLGGSLFLFRKLLVLSDLFFQQTDFLLQFGKCGLDFPQDFCTVFLHK